MHSLQTTSMVTRLGLCSLTVLLMHGGACRERSAAPKTGIPVSPAEVNRLSKLLSAQAATKQQIHQHFKDSGYRFNLCLAEGRGGGVTDLGQGGSMLICSGVETGTRAIEVERELQALLSPDEQDGMRIVFVMGLDSGTQLVGGASQFMEYTAERTEAERVATLIREDVGIDFGTVENKFATANQLHEFVQYGVNEKDAVAYLVVGSGMSSSPLKEVPGTDLDGVHEGFVGGVHPHHPLFDELFLARHLLVQRLFFRFDPVEVELQCLELLPAGPGVALAAPAGLAQGFEPLGGAGWRRGGAVGPVGSGPASSLAISCRRAASWRRAVSSASSRRALRRVTALPSLVF